MFLELPAPTRRFAVEYAAEDSIIPARIAVYAGLFDLSKEGQPIFIRNLFHAVVKSPPKIQETLRIISRQGCGRRLESQRMCKTGFCSSQRQFCRDDSMSPMLIAELCKKALAPMKAPSGVEIRMSTILESC